MEWQTGDLVFTQIGNHDNAISAVTSGWRGARVNRMGVVCMEVLQGEPGSNPGNISRDERVEIVRVAGAIGGMDAP